MLSDAGMSEVDGGWEIRICDWCNSHLSKRPQQMPKFALKNNLYRWFLPEHLKDLTWVEEQVCALYRSTAFVTRLYGSDDVAQPHKFRGNTCAFAQNTISTAKKLPRTPADVNDLLSVVFTGVSEKVPDSCLKNVFRVRKGKILAFIVRTIANTPHRDPRQYLRGAIQTESERRRYQCREDVGAWTNTQEMIEFDELPHHIRRGVIVGVDADLA